MYRAAKVSPVDTNEFSSCPYFILFFVTVEVAGVSPPVNDFVIYNLFNEVFIFINLIFIS